MRSSSCKCLCTCAVVASNTLVEEERVSDAAELTLRNIAPRIAHYPVSSSEGSSGWLARTPSDHLPTCAPPGGGVHGWR